jgi:acyl phosphate:glycerol-3-phosphate acyltransferase
MIKFVFIAVESYLLGSIPFGYLLVRVFRGEDVRQIGSGNIGATNVSRKWPLLGGITLLLDALKGAAAVVVAYLIGRHAVHDTAMFPDLTLAALFAVVGHMAPVWLKLRGGKGVATGLGSFLLIAPKAVLIAMGIFILIVAIFRYVSLASMIAVAVFPLIAWQIGGLQLSPAALGMIAFTSLLIILKHHQNIRRLLAGKENRIGARSA